MDLGDGVVKCLKDKTIFVTGSTGFLAKVFVEKILRAQPDVKKIFLLIRAHDAESASQRLQTEVISKQLFGVLKDKYGDGYNAFMTSKLFAVAGDISLNDLGITDSKLRQDMCDETNIVVNVAANTNFDERYEVALDVNTMGPKRVLKFAQQCGRIEMLLHVSTAYVAGSKEGLLLERKFKMGESLASKDLKVDIEQEVKLAKETIEKLRFEGTTKEEEKHAMKELGITRAKYFGWPNTYVFTKALGEMILGHMKGDLPLVIMRPTIITSLYKEPIPGWMEGSRTIDSLIIGYAKGKLSCFLGDMDLIMDVIPGDLVVNAMIVAMVAHSKQPTEIIYHVSSSVRNPVKYITLLNSGHQYFCEHPRRGKDGKLLLTSKLPIFSTMETFHAYMNLRFKIPLEALGLLNTAFCGMFSEKYNYLSRRYRFVMHLVDLYEPYAFFRGWFDDLNMERLRIKAQADIDSDELKMFWFDSKSIDWDYYFHEVHIPGVLKYVCR